MTLPLPRSAAELDAWGVFADLLIERGDRLGNHLALELALPAVPVAEQLASFQKSAAKVCRTPPLFCASWVLGHVHSLSLTPDLSKPMPQLEGDALPALGELLRLPALAVLEQLTFSASRTSIGRRWQDALAALPPSCRRFELQANRFTARDAAKMLERIPSQIEVLRVLPMYGTDPSLLVSDQFEWVDLRKVLINPGLARSLGSALASTSRVKVRVGSMTDRSWLTEVDRVVVGDDGDAALIAADDRGPLTLFERTALEPLQQRHGVVPVRAQLARSLKESYRLGRTLDPATTWAGDGMLIRDEGQWWVQATGAPAASPWLTLEGAPLSATSVALAEGAQIEIDRRSWTFTTRPARAGG